MDLRHELKALAIESRHGECIHLVNHRNSIWWKIIQNTAIWIENN